MIIIIIMIIIDQLLKSLPRTQHQIGVHNFHVTSDTVIMAAQLSSLVTM